jgi:hypothetical protein
VSNRLARLNWRLLRVLLAVSVMFACSGGGLTSPTTAAPATPKSFCASASSTLHASTLQFDDLVFTPNAVSNPSANSVPNGYGGLTWTNFQVSQPVSCAQAPSQSGCPSNNGLVNGVVSPPNVVLTSCSNGCVAGSVSSSTPFDLVSGYFTGVWRDALQVTVTGVNDAKSTTCAVTFSVNTTGPTFELLNVNDVTRVTLVGTGGAHNPNVPPNVDGTNFVLDNLSINH